MPDFKIYESAVTKDCEQLLQLNHVPNWRSSVLHGQFRGFGQKKWYVVKSGTKGLSDWQFICTDGSGRTIYIEFKRPGGKQREGQAQFESMCIENNVPYYLIEHWQDLAEVLEEYGMLKIKM